MVEKAVLARANGPAEAVGHGPKAGAGRSPATPPVYLVTGCLSMGYYPTF